MILSRGWQLAEELAKHDIHMLLPFRPHGYFRCFVLPCSDRFFPPGTCVNLLCTSRACESFQHYSQGMAWGRWHADGGMCLVQTSKVCW